MTSPCIIYTWRKFLRSCHNTKKMWCRNWVVKNRDFWTMPSISDGRVDWRVRGVGVRCRKKKTSQPWKRILRVPVVFYTHIFPSAILGKGKKRKKRKCITLLNYFLATTREKLSRRESSCHFSLAVKKFELCSSFATHRLYSCKNFQLSTSIRSVARSTVEAYPQSRGGAKIAFIRTDLLRIPHGLHLRRLFRQTVPSVILSPLRR